MKHSAISLWLVFTAQSFAFDFHITVYLTRTLHPILVTMEDQCLSITTHLVLGMVDGLVFIRCQIMRNTLQ